MDKTVKICDRCGKEKGAENHWFSVKAFLEEEDPSAFHLYPLTASTPPGLNSKDLCGEQCVIAEVQEWLSGQTP